MADDIAGLVREGDRDRYLAMLFAPADTRPHLFALYAFNLEIALVRERITEPAAGEIRFQWWREVLEGPRRAGDPLTHSPLPLVPEDWTGETTSPHELGGVR